MKVYDVLFLFSVIDIIYTEIIPTENYPNKVSVTKGNYICDVVLLFVAFGRKNFSSPQAKTVYKCLRHLIKPPVVSRDNKNDQLCSKILTKLYQRKYIQDSTMRK